MLGYRTDATHEVKDTHVTLLLLCTVSEKILPSMSFSVHNNKKQTASSKGIALTGEYARVAVWKKSGFVKTRGELQPSFQLASFRAMKGVFVPDWAAVKWKEAATGGRSEL